MMLSSVASHPVLVQSLGHPDRLIGCYTAHTRSREFPAVDRIMSTVCIHHGCRLVSADWSNDPPSRPPLGPQDDRVVTGVGSTPFAPPTRPCLDCSSYHDGISNTYGYSPSLRDQPRWIYWFHEGIFRIAMDPQCHSTSWSSWGIDRTTATPLSIHLYALHHFKGLLASCSKHVRSDRRVSSLLTGCLPHPLLCSVLPDPFLWQNASWPLLLLPTHPLLASPILQSARTETGCLLQHGEFGMTERVLRRVQIGKTALL